MSGPGTAPPGRPPSVSRPDGLRIAAGPFAGHIGISADGVGMALSSTGNISVKIHDPNSTILAALLYSKPNNYATISQIGFNGQVVPLTFVTTPASVGSTIVIAVALIVLPVAA